MKYLKTYEDINTVDLNSLLCVETDYDFFTVGKIYEIYKKPSKNVIENNTSFTVRLKDDRGGLTELELHETTKEEGTFTNLYENLVFTLDKSYEDYKIRKTSKRYNL